eukprot:CAMPEP_0119121768 /NCGR_PEP_ID=MMETSP1310-20130426/2243_1 /TAXON_ID=464262 /ORGANISM="Genus nov. species nov., Strain RCC2339" /LENGTH=581 /DNA_ID=CAMNT_0007111345 /DNA_START=89 /DNA_END=1831 /DNA_ORIENTATION=-
MSGFLRKSKGGGSGSSVASGRAGSGRASDGEVMLKSSRDETKSPPHGRDSYKSPERSRESTKSPIKGFLTPRRKTTTSKWQSSPPSAFDDFSSSGDEAEEFETTRTVTLSDCSKNQRLRAFFKAFLHRTRGLEHFMLWETLNDIRAIQNETGNNLLVRALAKCFYAEFLKPGAVYEVTTQSTRRDEIAKALEAADSDTIDLQIFDEAEFEAIVVLQTECLQKFRTGVYFRRFVEYEDLMEAINRTNTKPRGKREMLAVFQRTVFDDMLQEERIYLKKVRFLVQHVFPAMETFLAKDDVSIISGAYKDLYQVHERLQNCLQPDTPLWGTITVFIEDWHLNDFYERHVQNVPFSRILLSEVYEDPASCERMEYLEQTCKGLFGGDSLRTVVESLAREHLQFITAELKALHPKFHSTMFRVMLLDATRQLEGVANIVCEDDAHYIQLLWLRKSLRGYPGKLAKPERKLLHQGPLRAMIDQGFDDYYAFLFNDKLVLSKRIGEESFEYRDFFPLVHATIAKENGNSLHIHTGCSATVLRFDESAAFDEWYKQLAAVINDWDKLHSKQKLGRKKSMSKAPRLRSYT